MFNSQQSGYGRPAPRESIVNTIANYRKRAVLEMKTEDMEIVDAKRQLKRKKPANPQAGTSSIRAGKK